MPTDTDYMLKCLSLARRGRKWVSPNPMVGAVLVKNGEIIASAYHSHFGGLHAEAKVLKKAGQKAKGATLYVNLEPCVHHGKTPPCVDAIIAAGVKKVVVGSLDPNPLVNGKGVRKLRQAGVLVAVGTRRGACVQLNRKFFKYIETGLPWVTLKLAQTADGFIAQKNGFSKWITGPRAGRFVHELRAEHDAILVGANTVIADDPHLTLHGVKGRQPWRVVLDSKGRIPRDARVLNDKFKDRTLILANCRDAIKRVPTELAQQNISSILVEGGAQVADSFLKAGLIDEFYLFTAPQKFGEGLKTFADEKLLKDFKVVEKGKIGPDLLQVMTRHN